MNVKRYFRRKHNGLYYRLHRIANEGSGNPAEKVFLLIPQNRTRLGPLRTPPTDVDGALPQPIYQKDMELYFDEVSANDLNVLVANLPKAEPETKKQSTKKGETDEAQE